MVVDKLVAMADSFVSPEKKQNTGMSFGQARTATASSRPGQTRLMHQCKRDSKCECVDLLVFYITLLHLNNDTSNISLKLEAVQVHEPKTRLPFKAFLAWVQLEMYLGRLEGA